MKRIMLFSWVFLGLVVATGATSPSAAVKSPPAPVTVGVVNLDQELALFGQNGVESTPMTCTLCLTQFNCTGQAGAACADNCTCQVCGGSLGCRPNPPCLPPGPCPIGPPNVDDDPPPQP